MAESAHARRARPIGRPARISREAIVDAVLEIGIDKATLAEVADRLSVDPSTLYGHVRNRDDMLDAAADAALGRAPWPDEAEGDWRTFLTAISDALWTMYSENPGLAVHLRSMRMVPPTLITRSAQIVSTLCQRFGLSVFQAALVTDTIGDTVIDSLLTMAQLDQPSALDPGRLQRETAAAAVDAGPGGVQQEYARVIREAVGTPGHSDEWWRQKVELVLDGLAYRLQTAERSS